MNPRQIEYFRQLLLRQRGELASAEERFQFPWQEEKIRQPDILDQCAAETARFLALADQARRRRLIARINGALRRIEEGTYGYCEETGEEIGLRRLCVQPMAHLSIEAQEEREKRRRFHAADRRVAADTESSPLVGAFAGQACQPA